jgi:hypothetical protein
LAALALSAFASSTGAQQAQTKAKVRVFEPSGSPMSIDLFIVRDANGAQLQAVQEFSNTWSYTQVGRKLNFEFKKRGLKHTGFDVVLEDAPIVYLTMLVDPETGRVKYVKQKPEYPHLEKRSRSKTARTGTGQIGVTLVPPVNNACASALPLFDGFTAFSTIDATTDGAPVPGAQYDGQTYEDIWYIHTPTCNGTLTVSTCGTAAYDTDLVLYEADTDNDGDFDVLDAANITSGAEVALAANDDAGSCAGFTSVVSTTVAADKDYIVRVGGFGPGDEGTGTLLVSCGGAPSNDICTAPDELDCGTSITDTNVAATTAGSDPLYSCAFGGPTQGDGTLWYEFTAISDSAFLSTSASTGVTDTILAVYDGSCGSLVELACDDDSGFGFLSELCVDGLTIGNSYLVQVSSYPGSELGRVTIELECPGPCEVPCDDVLTACDILCGDSYSVDNTNATTDPLDPDFSCRTGGPDQGFGTLWFKFVATATSARIDTNASIAFDTLLAVYSGLPGGLTELACSDDEGVGFRSEFCVEGLTIGETYYIQAASYGPFDTGEITVTLECPCPAPPPNDLCEDAIALGALPASVTVDVTLATDDIVTPCGVASGPFYNVWYSVIGTGNTLTVSTCNSGTLAEDTKISVFCGDCLGLVCVTGNDDQDFPDDPVLSPCGFHPFNSGVSWCSQAGATYLITVGMFLPSTTPGVVQLDVSDTGDSCVADVQCLPTGACCLADSSCVTTTAGDCASLGGDYQGDGTECDTQFITDGSFEDGAFAGNWSEFSTNFGTPLCDASCGFNGGDGPHTGDWFAWFGGIDDFEEGSLEQSITIPVAATTLEFWLEIPASSGNGVDFLEVNIDGSQVFEVFEDDVVYAGTGYNLVSVPLAGFNDGGSHDLEFHSIVTGMPALVVSNFSVDDVSLVVTTFDCTQCFTLDFETDDSAAGLVHGQRIDAEFDGGANYPVTITGGSYLEACGTLAGTAAILDSDNGPAAQDPDLLVQSGNILILQTDLNQSECSPGVYCTHNDDDDGGSVTFAFNVPVEPTSVDLIDVDDSGPDEVVTVTLTDSNTLTRTYTVPVNWTGDYVDDGTGQETLLLNTLAAQPGFSGSATAVEDLGFDQTSVVSIVIDRGDDCPGSQGGSGAIDNLIWCQ